MSDASKIQPGQRDPNLPPGLPVVAVAAIMLCTLMYVIYPGHGPIQGHVAAPAANASPG